MLEHRDRSAVTVIARTSHTLPRIVLALLGLLLAQPAWSQAVCTWNQNGPGQWDNPGNWDNCSGGNGSPSGTPGSADHAIVGNIAPLADIDIGSTPRVVDRLTLSAGRIFGNGDLTISTHLTWTGGTIDGAGGPTLLILSSGSAADFSGAPKVLAKRDLRILGGVNWTDGDIQLREDAEIDNQGVLTVDALGPIRASNGIPTTLNLTSDGSPLARLHNASTPGARIEKLGGGFLHIASNVQFDNGNDVLVTEGTLQILSGGGDFGAYQVAAIARLEFGMPTGVPRNLTGSSAVSGAGTLHKFGTGDLTISGGYTLSGLTDVVDGTLYLDTPANPLTLSRLHVQAPGVFSSADDLVVSTDLTWKGGDIIGGGATSTLTIPVTATATVNLDDTHLEANLRSTTWINQGVTLISGTGTSPSSNFFRLDSASIDNQGDFELRASNLNNLVLNCVTTDCGSFFNRSGATLRLNDIHGIVVIGEDLTTLNNDGLVSLVSGCGLVGPPGVDTGTYRYDSSCTLAFFTRPDKERVFEQSVVLDQIGGSFLQFEGSLRVNGSGRTFGNIYIQPAATLFGPAAIHFGGNTHWRGLIEGASQSETVTVDSGALLHTSNVPADSPLLFKRTLTNNGQIDIGEVRLQLDGNAEIVNNGDLNLIGTPAAAGAIGCATPPNCGLLTNTSSGVIRSNAVQGGLSTQLETDIAVVNQGSLLVDSGRLDLDSDYTAAAGSALEVGFGAGLRRTAGHLVLAAGALRGAGAINANVDVDAVTVEPAGVVAGNLGIVGNFTATANTVYTMGIANAVPPLTAGAALSTARSPSGLIGYDRLTVSGSATLGGTVNVVDLVGFTPQVTDVFDLLVYASYSGSVLTGSNPYSGAGFVLQTDATRVRLTQPGAGGCVWNPGGSGADDWTNPLKWTNCGSGVGPGPGPVGTPGASDTAVVGGGSVNLDVPVSVSGLQLTGGTVQGPSNLTVINDLIWTGGRFQGASGSLITLSAGATATLSGGQHTVDGRTLRINGSATWTTGLIELANAAILDIGATGTLISNPSLAFESIFGNGVGTAEVRNAGAIVKQGPNQSGIGTSVQYSGAGSVTISAGDLVFAATSVTPLNASYSVNAGANLRFVGGNRTFGGSASLGGAGNLIFGDSAPVAGINTVDGCITAGTILFIQNAEVVLNCASPTVLGALSMLDTLAVLEGSSAISVTSAMSWGYGTIRGSGIAQTFTVASGANVTFGSPRGPGIPRTLHGRRFINHGAITWVGGNALAINNGGAFENDTDGQFTLDGGGGTRSISSDQVLSPRMVNRGTLTVLNATFGDFDVEFDNLGAVQLTGGTLRLRRNGNDSGSYAVSPGNVLEINGAGVTRTLVTASSLTGLGTVAVVAGAALAVNGSFSPADLTVGSTATVAFNTTGGIDLQHLTINDGTLTGNNQVVVHQHLLWEGGSVVGTGASPGPLVVDSGATAVMDAPNRILDKRTVRFDGAASWLGGSLRVPMNSAGRLMIAAGGSLTLDTTKTTASFGCVADPCIAEIEIAGTLQMIGDGANLTTSTPLLLSGGVLHVENSNFATANLQVNGGTVEVMAPGALTAATVVLTAGELRGTGILNAAVDNQGGTLRPGASPGTLTIVGSYIQGAAAFLVIEIGGPTPGINADRLSVSTTATLAGTLNIVDVGYTPVAPQAIEFLHANSGLTGTFGTVNNPYSGYGISYTSNSALLSPTVGPLVVNDVGDAGDGTCDASCTLRDALIGANLAPDADVIQFAIPSPQCTGPGGACVIAPTSPLPAITAALVIDGYTQPGATPNTQAPSLGLGSNAVLRIELDGSLTSGVPGLVINAPGSPVTVLGLSIYRFATGIVSQGPGDALYHIVGNFIGLRGNGSAAPAGQLAGVSVQGGTTLIGDATAAGINVISANSQQGISIQSVPALAGVAVRGNLIGTTPSGLLPMPNGQQGIIASTSTQIQGIVIGGAAADARNVISGNAQDGIRFDCTATAGNCFDGARVIGNFIGPAANGAPLGNAGNGVQLAAMIGGRVDIGGTAVGEGNVIAGNGGNGILATFGGVGRGAFQGNVIFSNGQLPIDLGGDGRTANDAGDVDTGPNGRLNFPLITSYTLAGPGNGANISATLSTPDIGGNYPARVEFYKAIEDEPGVYLGATTCIAPPSPCTANLTFPGSVILAPDDIVLAMVTDGFGKSSEVSVYNSATTVVSDTPDPSTIGTPYTVTVEVASTEPFVPAGAVNVNDGINTCPITLASVGPGLASGSCMLPSVAPAGPITLTANYLSGPNPFFASSNTAAHVIAAAGAPPVITRLSRSTGPVGGGTVVSLSGSNFVVGATTVVFGATVATTANCTSTTQCTATSPAGTGRVSVRATTALGISADTAADDFSYIGAPTLCTNVAPASNFAAGAQPYGMATGDFNADGKRDLAIVNSAASGSVSILLGNGSGGFAAAVPYAVGAFPRGVAVGDFNGDGTGDLAVANYGATTVSILLGSGGGSFGAATAVTAGTGPHGVAVGDFNGDGRADLAVALLDANSVAIVLGNGDGTFGAASINTSLRSTAIRVGDFNKDGAFDLTVGNQSLNTASVVFGNGSGGFGAPSNYAAGTLPSDVAVGDFNGDGFSDLALSNRTSGNVAVLLGAAGGIFGTANLYAAGTQPTGIDAGDFNGDGALDLVVSNFGSGNASLLLGTGTGSFGTATSLAAGSGPNSVAFGDFNGDNRTDIAVANGISTDVSILINLGCAAAVTAISPTTGPTTGGTVVTLTGTDFVVGGTSVNFGATPATAVNCSSTLQCTATSPAGSGVVDVIATTAAGSSANTAADDYTYTCPPTVVTTGNDSGLGSLRQVIADACAGSVVTFGGGVGAVTLTSGELLIAKNLTIDGGLGVSVARQAAAPSFRIFNIGLGSTVVLDSLTISNGNVAGDGAGILSAGSLTVLDSVISGNTATGGFSGGGIANDRGTLVVDNSTISGNSAAFYGGGVVQYDGGSATLTRSTLTGNTAAFGGAVMSQAQPTAATLSISNCTISGNSASSDGPGIYLLAASAGTTSMSLRNSTIANQGGVGAAVITRVISGTATSTLQNNVYAGNLGPNVSTQGTGVNTSLGNNVSDDATGGGGAGDLVNTDPLLAPLANYGGATQTHALLPGSPAINAANNAAAPATDQRGVARPQQGTADIGAFESQGFVLSVVSGTPQSAPLNTVFALPLLVSVTATGAGEPVNGGAVTYTAPGAGASAVFSSPATLTGGQASVIATANNTVGSYSVTASAAGASGAASFVLSNGVAVTPTSTVISTIAPEPSVVGQPYTVTVAVADGVMPVGTGTVEVRQLSDGAICLINLATASSCQLTADSALTTAVRASYLGAAGYAPSSSAVVPHLVNRADTQIAITNDSPDPSGVGQPITVSVRVSVAAPGAGVPRGDVLVTDGIASCGMTLPTFSCTLVPKAVGQATLEARYLGDANFNASVGTDTHTITVDGADLAIVKRNGLRLLPGGLRSTYVLLVTNTGPQAVVNARVSDILPGQLSNGTWTCTASGGGSCPANGAGSIDALVNLPVGASVSFALTVTAQATPEQVVSNRATVTAPANAPDPVPTNNESTDTDPIGIFGEGFETETE